jgi:aminomethyltransferase
MSRNTPLHRVHDQLGANFTDFAGYNMPVRYTSDVAEHHAVRTTAGIFDLSHMGEIEVQGAEAGEALDYALVGRPSKIRIGRARYSMICGENGGVLDDLVVYRLAEDSYLVVANAGNAHTVLAELARRAEEFDASVQDALDAWALIAVQGPRSADILRQVGDPDIIDALKYYTIAPTRIADIDVLLARTGYTGEDGFELYVRPDLAEPLWRLLSTTGEPFGLQPAGLASRDTLRLEAGMPLYGNELTTQTTPFDVGLGRLVSFDKPAGFVGEDALKAVRDQQPSHVLVGLVTEGRRSPRHGHAVLDADGTSVGEVTSGAPSPTLGHAVAMAYVQSTHAEPGNALAVDIRGKHEPVRVVPLPFYSRP